MYPPPCAISNSKSLRIRVETSAENDEVLLVKSLYTLCIKADVISGLKNPFSGLSEKM